MHEAPRFEPQPIPSPDQTRSVLFQATRLLEQRSDALDHPERLHVETMRFNNHAMSALWDRNLAGIPLLLTAGLLGESQDIRVTNGLESIRRNSPDAVANLQKLLHQAHYIRINGGKVIFPSENPEHPPIIAVIGGSNESKGPISIKHDSNFALNIRSLYQDGASAYSVAFTTMWAGNAAPLYEKK